VMARAREWLKRHETDANKRARKLNALAASGLDDALRRRDSAEVELLVARCLGDSVRLTDLGLRLANIRNANAERGR
jgi:hypothetical protein